jgi:hypothetical protein
LFAADLISRVTDAVLDEVREWQNRPLDPVYPARPARHNRCRQYPLQRRMTAATKREPALRAGVACC